MPTPLHLVPLLAASAVLIACNGAVPPSSPSSARTTTQVTPNNKTFAIAARDRFSIVLPSAGSGGYQWHLSESADSRVVRLVGTRVGDLPKDAPLGRFADEIFDFEGVGAGTTTLVFLNYREWEGPSRAVETRTYPVTVR